MNPPLPLHMWPKDGPEYLETPRGDGLGESLGSTISDTPRTDAAAVGLYEVREDGYKIRRMVVDVELCEDIERENVRLLAGCEQAEKLVNAGGYTKWQDGAWWIFWESSGEVAAGPAKSLYELALILSNAGRQGRREDKA